MNFPLLMSAFFQLTGTAIDQCHKCLCISGFYCANNCLFINFIQEGLEKVNKLIVTTVLITENLDLWPNSAICEDLNSGKRYMLNTYNLQMTVFDWSKQKYVLLYSRC